MNVVKFRAWNKHGFWMYGGLVYRELGNAYFIINSETLDAELVDPLDHKSIGQSTGLNDKNGKEIFKGDILEFGGVKSWKSVVEWDSMKAGFLLTPVHIYPREEGSHFKGEFINPRYKEIIGNIYENPELLN